MTNLLADFVVRFNAAAKKNVEFFYVPYSSLNYKIANLLFKRRCINTFTAEVHPTGRYLRIKIVPFFTLSQPLIRKVELISKPGLRQYWTASRLAYMFARNNFQGFYILSTPVGVCSSNELIFSNMLSAKTGGEVLLKIHL